VVPGDELTIRDEPESHRYTARLGDEIAGFVDYRALAGRRVLLHTEVLPAFSGRGIAGELARFALDAARAAGHRVTPKCPFILTWLERHPEYEDIVTRRPGSPRR
jgi:predicted GNAT family acetyltransferase